MSKFWGGGMKTIAICGISLENENHPNMQLYMHLHTLWEGSGAAMYNCQDAACHLLLVPTLVAATKRWHLSSRSSQASKIILASTVFISSCLKSWPIYREYISSRALAILHRCSPICCWSRYPYLAKFFFWTTLDLVSEMKYFLHECACVNPHV